MVSVRVDLVASMPHYESHLRPIWEALPDEVKGDIRTGTDAGHTPPRNHVCLVASWKDMHLLRGLTKFIYVEHGAGQSYGGDEKSAHWPDYSASGGYRHMDVLGYICPSERVAKLWKHPNVAVVGSPKLDRFLANTVDPVEKTYSFTFHWPCKVAPEADTAYWHYASSMERIVDNFKDQGWTGYYHVHPKWDGTLDRPLAQMGLLPLVGDDALLVPEVVFCDNSSLAFEAAALDRIIGWLNCPEYRRDVNHGLRFWDAAFPSISFDDPQQLLDLPLDVWAYSQHTSERSWDAAMMAYSHIDEFAADRAVDSIMTWLP